jgi:hypothetical protein
MQYVTVLSTKTTEDTVAHELHAEDRQAIGEILSLHGHLFDGGHLGRPGEIFTPDVVYDMSAVGAGTFEGNRGDPERRPAAWPG